MAYIAYHKCRKLKVSYPDPKDPGQYLLGRLQIGALGVDHVRGLDI